MNRIVRPFRWHVLAGALLLGAPLGAPSPVQAAQPEKHVTFKASLAPFDPFSERNAVNLPADAKLEVRRGEKFLLILTGTPATGWHTYPIVKMMPGQEAQLSTVKLKNFGYVANLGLVKESEPELVDVPGIGKQYEYEKPFTWVFELLVRPNAPPGQTLNVEAEINLQVCDANGCTLETHVLSKPVLVSAKDAVPLSPETEKRLREYDAKNPPQGVQTDKDPSQAVKPDKTVPTPQGPFVWQDYEVVDRLVLEDDGGPAKDSGLWATLVTAVIGGFVSLLTPCVFPMIPVTVSFFLKQAERQQHRALTMAAVYAATIVAVLTLGGIVLVKVLVDVSQHYLTNIFLTGVFLFFALSLLGMYEITLPSGLSNLTASGEGKGGLIGIVFMALTFSIISFACVGPIYGAFITLEASSQSAVTGWLQRFLGPFAFAVAFASPFFLLALFPSLLRSLPKSGSWMNSVKVVMGFLELAAAFKFVRAAELNLTRKTDYFSFDLVLGIYVALAVACGLYLLNVYRLPHDHGAPEAVGVPRLVLSLVFLSFGLYLLPGLFKGDKGKSQQPRGEAYQWVQAFLLPDDPSDWQTNMGVALAQAEREKKLLFIDFTGLG
jgi:thiol:disulfide interchange protein DsbD